ncbi:type IV secretory system conjugative DNA transfer family protein [Lentilactobacillus senioris]|uniref:type IV secretory system conjugative DNA transfer family protein n=1 Tax=Lentilactobacillus senioris TaxID=931534 RepID=UPI003AF298BA
MNGTILGIVDKRIVYQNNSTKPNRNIFVVGGPGSYKTQSVVITNLFNETENSIVVTDPKGELYEKTAGIKLAQGYQVHVVNFAVPNPTGTFLWSGALDHIRPSQSSLPTCLTKRRTALW